MDLSFLIDWCAGELHAPFKWKDPLNFILLLYMVAAAISAFVYYYTNIKNLNERLQHRYFWKVILFTLLLTWMILNSYIATTLADVATLSNHLYLSMIPPLIYYIIPFLLVAFLIRKYGRTKKRYLPAFLAKHK